MQNEEERHERRQRDEQATLADRERPGGPGSETGGALEDRASDSPEAGYAPSPDPIPPGAASQPSTEDAEDEPLDEE